MNSFTLKIHRSSFIVLRSMYIYMVCAFFSCARETTIDLPEELPKTVAVCHFQPGEPFRLNLSRSQPVFDGSQFEVVSDSDATVSLSVEGKFWGKMEYRFDDELDRFVWKSKKNVEGTSIYTLSVRVPGEPELEATSSTPVYFPLKKIKMDSENIRTVTLPDGTKALRVPLTLELYYLPISARYFAFQFNHETDVYKIDNTGNKILDYSYSGASSFTANGRTLSLLNDISEAEPMVLVNENYWSDNTETLKLDAIIPYFPDREVPRRLFVEWRTLSEEFYKYHLSLSRQTSSQPLNDPDAVYNNVKNGYGNFSGYTTAHDTLVLPF